MAETYKIWLHCERYDEETGDGCGEVGLPLSASATFDTEDEAIAFARELHDIAAIITGWKSRTWESK